MFRALALIFAVLALVVLASDAWPLVTGEGAFRWSPLGEWWFRIHQDSLQLVQPAVERHVSPLLWSHVIQPLLESPLVVVLAVLAVLCWLMRRRMKPGRGDRPGGIDGARR